MSNDAYKLMEKINNHWKKIAITNTYDLADFHIRWARKYGVTNKFKIIKLSKTKALKIWKASPFKLD